MGEGLYCLCASVLICKGTGEGCLNKYFVRYALLDFITNTYVCRRRDSALVRFSMNNEMNFTLTAFYTYYLWNICMWLGYEVRWMIHYNVVWYSVVHAWYGVMCYIRQPTFDIMFSYPPISVKYKINSKIYTKYYMQRNLNPDIEPYSS